MPDMHNIGGRERRVGAAIVRREAGGGALTAHHAGETG
jgi:hypothetical protein